MTKYISELFEEFEKLKSRKEKLEFLKEHKDNAIFKAVLQGTFDPNIQWNITDIPEYKPDDGPIGVNPSSLFDVIPKCTIFAIGHPKSVGLKEKRMKELLIQHWHLMKVIFIVLKIIYQHTYNKVRIVMT